MLAITEEERSIVLKILKSYVPITRFHRNSSGL